MGPQQPQNIDRELNLINEVITKNTNGIIVIPAKPTPDAIASGTALYLALTKMGKNVSLVCSSVPESDLTGVDKIKTSINTGGNNLVVSFPYKEGAIDKVDYNIADEKFNLIIIPREGMPKLEPKDVNYSYSGGKVDFIITVDAPNLNSLGDIYTQNQNKFDGKNIINIDRHLINNAYGTINLVVKSISSTAEIMLKVMKALKVQIDRDMATNLYSGIVGATNNFSSYSVNADTFEAVADLLRAGAVKKPMRQFSGRPGMPGQMGMGGMNPFTQGMPQQPMNRPMSNGQAMPQFQQSQRQQQQMPQQPVQNQQPQQQPQPQVQSNEKQIKPIENVEVESNVSDTDDSSTPETWLKPKIFNDNDGLV